MKIVYKRIIGMAVIGLLTSLQCLLAPLSSFADPPTVSLLSPSEGKTIYTTGTIDYPVKIVFKTWDKSDGIKTSGANSFILYWEGASSGSKDMSDPAFPELFHNWGPADTATDVYRSYDWVPPGPGTYKIQVQSTDNAGSPSTGKSRKVEVTIRSTALNKYSGFPGDGKLLIRDNDNTICMSCHAIKAHSSADIGSTKYGNWERVCRDCHTPHSTRNIFLLQSSFKIYTGVNQTFAYRRKVDFRNISGESAFGFVTESGKERRGPCEVCHTRTQNLNGTPRWRNYTSEADSNGEKHNGGLACIACHYHKEGFKPGESEGNANCNGCHPDIFDPMNRSDDGYHHFMSNALVTELASGSKYPVLTSIMGETDDPNRRCLMCHVDHDIFRKDLNEPGNGRAANLRRNIGEIPTLTGGVDTDFLEADADGGICLSCHQRSQIKSYTQPDGTIQTPVITKAMFIDSPHNYKAPVTFNEATEFQANCSKCHIDTLKKTKQIGGTQVGPHYSQIRRINAASINENNLGTATGGTSTTLVDTSKSWASNIWAGWPITILEGTGAGQTLTISSSDTTSVTVSGTFSPVPSTDSVYLISVSRGIDSDFSSGGNSATTLNDNNATWIVNYWKDRPVTITRGTGYGQTSRVKSNSDSILTLYTSYKWQVVPDETSQYSLGDPSEEEVCYRCHSMQRNPFAADGKEYFGVLSFNNKKVLNMEGLFNDPARPYKHRIDNYFARHRGDESETAPDHATTTGWFNDVSGGTHTGCQDCHNPHANRHPGDDSGTAEFGTITTLFDENKAWAPDEWRGYVLKMKAGTGSGQERLITGNDATTLRVGAVFGDMPDADSFYIIQPYGHPEKGNNLWFPNSGIWGVTANYSTVPVIGTMEDPIFTKDSYLEGGKNKIYELCFKCHSEYAWGTEGSPFSIADSINNSGNLAEGSSTNIAEEFNPNNLGYHPVVGLGENQPISPTGFETVDFSGPHTAQAGTGGSSIIFSNTWNPNKYNGYCIEITSGSGAGEVVSITGHDSSGITGFDPAFGSSPASGSEFYIRKCSSFSVANWPRFTAGTLALTAGSSTASISGLSNGIPSSALRGWYIYAGTLNGSPLSPPQLSTKGWFQIKEIGAGASDADTSEVTLTISPTPTAYYSGTYALTAGLGNAFIPPYGPWSLMGCADCHDTNDSQDPSGPHASSKPWMLRTLEKQAFYWFYGGLASEGSSSTTDPFLEKLIAYGDGSDPNWNVTSDITVYACYNCHRADVYKTETQNSWSSPALPNAVGNFANFDKWRNMGRMEHVPGYGATPATNVYGIFCMNCHGGDNRAQKGDFETEPSYKALGGMHGSNLGTGYYKTTDNKLVSGGQSFRGRRLLNGAVWTGVTRATTTTQVACSSSGKDSINSCSANPFTPDAYRNNVVGGFGNDKAIYPYYSGPDMLLPTVISAVASDASGLKAGVQSGDEVVITFNGETNGSASGLNSGNIETALLLDSGTWGTVSSIVWTTTTYGNDTLTITFGTGGNISVGATITLDGKTVKNVMDAPVTGSVPITGTFGFWIQSAVAYDASGGGDGIQQGDEVKIIFDGATEGTEITSLNIQSALFLSNSHDWRDGTLSIYSSAWTNTYNTKDTLTITLSADGTLPTVAERDTITLDGTIRDSFLSPIYDNPVTIKGSFSHVPADAVAQFRLDEESGIDVYDDTLYENDGTIEGFATWTSGFFASGLEFDGIDDRIVVPDSESLDLTTAGTIEFWVKKKFNRANQVFVAKGDAFKVSDFSSGRVSFNWRNVYLRSSNILALNTWYHVVATYNGSHLKIYVNGVIDGSAASTTDAIANNVDLFIGSSVSGTLYFGGTMDQIVIYNKALTDDEVWRRYSKTKHAIASDSSGGGDGIQAGDRVFVQFNVPMEGTEITLANISTALDLGGPTWKDVNGSVFTKWTTIDNVNDTLIVTLNDTGGVPTVAVGNTITFDDTIKDMAGRPIGGTINIAGSFGTLPANVIAYWNFDEGAGPKAYDLTTNHNDGIVGGTSWVNGKSGKALYFESDYVSVTDTNNSLDLTTQGAVEFWMNRSSSGTGRTYVSKGNALRISDASGGAIAFKWGASTLNSTPVPANNSWYHVVATYDGLEQKIYLNGQPAGTKSWVGSASPNDNSFEIGRYLESPGTNITGVMDEVVVYSVGLTEDDVLDRYNKVKGAVANDASGSGEGIQTGDQIVIQFNKPTAANEITALNIANALTLNDHGWGTFNSATWNGPTNDTLTITLNADASVRVGDMITLDGTIKDSSGASILTSIAISGSFGAHAVLPDGAVGYWPLDEISGTHVPDATFHNNSGTSYGGQMWVAGRFGNALDFTPNGDYVMIPDRNSLDLTNKGTIELWARRDGNRYLQRYVSKGNGAGVIELYEYTSGSIRFSWGGTTITSPDNIAPANVWHHIVATNDGLTMTLYVDGVPVVSGSSAVVAETNADPLYIGQRLGLSNSYYFDGLIDDVVLYNRALEEPEIISRYGSNILSAIASDTQDGIGLDAGDQVVIKFSGPTQENPIDYLNIDTALSLNSGAHTWKGGNNDASSVSALWTASDTLTITLNTAGGSPTIEVGDEIALNGTIKDSSGRPINGTVILGGDFDSIPIGVVGYWNFDEFQGGTAHDASGNGNHGALLGPPTWVSGKEGNALNFDGFDGVSVDDDASLDLTTAGTIEFWVKKNDLKGYYDYFIDKGFPGGGYSYRVWNYYETGRIAVRWGTYSDAIVSDTVLTTGVWNHIVVTYDTTIDTLSLYLNGKLDKAVTWTTDATPNTEPLRIGGTTNGVNATMDEVAIYNTALSAPEIKARYGVNMISAVANDTSGGGLGIQASDEVFINFSASTDAPDFSATIDTDLPLSTGLPWNISSMSWSNGGYTNDVLTLVLSGTSNVKMGDTISINSVINGKLVNSSARLGGSFGAVPDMPDGLVAYWKMDEASGTAFDETENSNDSAPSGAIRAAGRFGNALSFDGVNDYAMAPHSNSLDLDATGSIEFWAYKNSNKNNQVYLSHGTPGSGFEYRVDENGTTGQVRFVWGIDTDPTNGTSGAVLSASPAPLNMWNHIVATYDGVNLKLYMNGVLSNSKPYKRDRLNPGSSVLYLGRSSAGNYLDGMMDDVAIYNRPLTQSEIEARFIVTLNSARTIDKSLGGELLQPGDEVILNFNGPTNGDLISAGNIDAALDLDIVTHSWLDGVPAIGYANWSTVLYTNDTLVVGLSGGNNALPTVASGDIITLGTNIYDTQARVISGSAIISGNFDDNPNFVGRWPFEEGGLSTTTDDKSHNNVNGKITDATWSTGRFGNGLNFNGSTAFVSFTTLADYALADSYAIEAWIRPTAFNSGGAFIYNGGTGGLRYHLALDSSGKVSYSIHPTGLTLGVVPVKSNISLKRNEWSHIVLTRDGTFGDNATLYINGVVDSTFPDNHFADTSGTLFVGKGTLSSEAFFKGDIDGVTLYNINLTGDQVKTRYHNWMSAVTAADTSGGGAGIQATDTLTITFTGPTNSYPLTVDNIDSVLPLNNGHLWKTGVNDGVSSVSWLTDSALEVVFTNTTSDLAVAPGDVITPSGDIQDSLFRPITEPVLVRGTFETIPADAVAYLKFDEASGVTVVDGTSYENDGLIYGNAARITPGKVGSGVSFDNTDDYIEIVDTNLNLGSALSVEFWFKGGAQAGGDTLVAGETFRITYFSPETNSGIITDAGWQGESWIAGGSIFDNNWHHYVFTWDGTSQQIYVDGILDPDVKGPTSGALVSQKTLRIGAQLSGGAFFSGVIDEVLVYNKALSQAEITYRFNNP